MCDNGDLGNCRVESCVYEIKCAICEGKGIRKVYIGETGKSGWERASQHWRDWRRKDSESSLHKHDMNEHEGKLKKTDMKMRIISKPRKALQRQVEEAVRISEEEPEALMNSKSEYGNNRIPRITVMVGDEEKARRKDREEKSEREKRKKEKEMAGAAAWEDTGEDVKEGKEEECSEDLESMMQ